METTQNNIVAYKKYKLKDKANNVLLYIYLVNKSSNTTLLPIMILDISGKPQNTVHPMSTFFLIITTVWKLIVFENGSVIS